MPRPLPPLRFSKTDIATLRAIEAEDRNVLPLRSRGRLKILIALSQGRRPSQIVREIGITAQGLLNIRKEAEAHGIHAITAALWAAIRTRQAKQQPTEPRKPGRPAIASLKEFADRQHPEKETVVELVALVMAADVQLAVLGIRVPVTEKADASGPASAVGLLAAKNVQKVANAAILNASDRIQWTGFPFDQGERFLFNELRARYQKAVDLGMMYRSEGQGNLRIDSFTTDWSFHVFYAGKPGVVRPLIARMISDRPHKLHHWAHETFCLNLEGVIHQIRIACNLRSLFPTFRELTSRLRSWEISDGFFQWQVTPDQINSCLRRRLAAYATIAHAGYLFGLVPYLVRTIPKRDRIPVKVLMPRPRVSRRSASEDGKKAVLRYFVLPEFGYDLTVNSNGLAKLELPLRDPHLAKRFEYATRLLTGQPATSFPKAILRRGGRLKNSETLPVGLISLPRQFLMPPPPIPLTALAKVATRKSRAATIQLYIAEKELPSFVFACPELLGAIKAAFERNAYGDSIAVLRNWKERLLMGLPTGNQPPSGWLWDLVSELPEIVPPFHFSNDELSGQVQSADTRRRLRASPVPDLAFTADGYRLKSEEFTFPGYDREAMWRKVFTDFDADFLLRKIDKKTWGLLQRVVAQLANRCQKVILDIYWSNANPPLWRFKNTIPEQFRFLLPKYGEELPSWASEVRPIFQPFPRVLRSAVENAQRFVLTGHPPLALAICTQDDLLRSWKSYLGRQLTKRLLHVAAKEKRGKLLDESWNSLKRQYDSWQDAEGEDQEYED